MPICTRAARWVLFVSVTLASAACDRRPTQLTVLLDTNATGERSSELIITSARGVATADQLRAMSNVWRVERTAAALFPSSVAVVPPAGAVRNATVSVLFRLRLAETRSEPAALIERVHRVTLLERAPQQARVFFNVACASTSTGCRSAPCTVSQRCIEQGQTCGDEGACVAAELPAEPVPPEVPLDATIVDARRVPTEDASFDGAMDSAADSATNDGASDAEAAADASGCARNRADCDRDASNGCEVDLGADRFNCGACGSACSARGRCVSGACRTPTVAIGGGEVSTCALDSNGIVR